MNLQQAEHAVSIYIAWAKAHEKLLAIVLGALLAWHFAGDIRQAWVAHEARLAASSDVLAQSARDQLKVSQDANAELVKRIDAAMAQRAQQTVVQKQKDDGMSTSDLAVRLQALVNAGHVQVDTTPSALPGTLTFDNDASHQVARDEEDLKQLKADNTDLNGKLVSCTDLNVKSVDALKSEQKSHADDVKLEKAKARGSWLRGFKWGAIVGIVGGFVVRH